MGGAREHYLHAKQPKNLACPRESPFTWTSIRALFSVRVQGAYPVERGARGRVSVIEDYEGHRRLVGPDCSWSEVTSALRLGIARMI